MAVVQVFAPVAANSKAAGSSLSWTIPAGGLPAGSVVILAVTWDNLTTTTPAVNGASGITMTGGGLTGGLKTEHNSPTATAGGGVRGCVASTTTTIDHNAGDTVSLSLTASVTAKAGVMFAYTGLLNTYRGTPAVATGVSSIAANALSITGLTPGDLMITSVDTSGITAPNNPSSGTNSATSGGNATTNVLVRSWAGVTAGTGLTYSGATTVTQGGGVLLAFQMEPEAPTIVRSTTWKTIRTVVVTRATSWDTQEVVPGYIPAPTTGPNLLPANDASFETGLGSWGFGTAVLSTVRAHSGSQSALYSVGTGRLQCGVTGLTFGRRYTLSGWSYAPSGSPDISLSMWHGDTSQGSYDYAPSVTTKDAWVRSEVTFIAQTENYMWFNGGGTGPVWLDDISVKETAAPNPVAFDDFRSGNGSNALYNRTTSTGRIAPTGQQWEQGAGDWAISGGAVVSSSGGSVVLDVGLKDCVVECALNTDADALSGSGLAVRFVDNNNLVNVAPVAGGWRITQSNNAVGTTLGTGGISSISRQYMVKVVCRGSNISVYMKGGQVYEDYHLMVQGTILPGSNVLNGTKYGLSHNGEDYAWDDFSVTPLTLNDNFNRADSAGAWPTGLGRASGGHPWEYLWGGGYIIGNQATVGHTDGIPLNGGAAAIDAGTPDVTITADRPVMAVESGFIARWTDINNYVWFSNSQCHQVIGGVDTYLGQYEAAGLASGDKHAVELNGSSIKLYRNDVLVFSTTTALVTGTKHGIAVYSTGSGANRWDNLSILPAPAPITRGPTTWKIWGPPPSISRSASWNVDKPSVTITRSTTWDDLTIVRPTRNLLSQADSTMEASIASNAELTTDPANIWASMPFGTAWTWDGGNGVLTHTALASNGKADLSRHSSSPILRPAATPDEFIVRISITLANQMKVVFGAHVGMTAVDASQGQFWKPAGSVTYKKELILPAGTSLIEYPVNVAATPVGTYPYISPYVSPIYDTIYTMGAITLDSIDLLSGSVFGWAAFGPGHTIVPSSTQVNSGAASMKISWSGGGGVPYVRTNPATAGFVVGQRYTVTAKVYLESGPPIGVGCESAANGPTTAIIGSWQSVAHSWVATATTHRPVINQGSSTTAGVSYVDNVVVGEAGTIERGTTWAVRPPPPTITRSTTWNAKGQPIATRSTTWDALRILTATNRVTTWQAKAISTKVLGQTTWRTKYALLVTGGRSTSWKIRQLVVLPRSTTWDATKTLVQAKSTTWDSRVPVVITRITQGGGGGYLADVLSDAPIGYWRVGETTTAGGAADASGNGYGGNYVGPPVVGVPGLLSGDGDTAMQVADSAFQGVTCGNPAAFMLDGNLALEAWIKTPSPGAAYRSVVVKQSAYGMFLIDGVFGTYEWGSAQTNLSGVNVVDGVRHHLVVVFGASGEAGGSQFFVDGAPVGSAFTHSHSNHGQALEIGHNQAGGVPQVFNGVIDEAAIYNYKLAPARIASHYTKGTTAAGGGGGWRVKQAVTLTRGTTWKVLTLLPAIEIIRSTTWKVKKLVGYSLVLVADDFTGPDNPTSIWNGTSLRSTPVGNLPWVGGGGATWGISSGWAVSSPVDGSLTLDPGTPDGVLEATLRTGAGAAVSGFNLRRTDGSNQLRIFARFDLNSWSLAKFVAGAQTYQVATAADGLVTTSSTYRVRVVMNGPTIDLYVDGAFIWSYAITDPVLLTGQRVGICQTTSGSADASWDNFQFTALPVRQANWDSRAPVVATRSSTWKIESQVQVTRSTTWDVTRTITSTRATTWDATVPVTIQRPDAGPAPWTPAQLTGLATWIDANDYVPGTWTNKGGGAVPTIAGTPPMAIGATLNGMPTVRFKTGEGRLRSGWSTGVNDYTLLYLVRWVGPNAGRAWTVQYPPSNFLVGMHTSQPDTMYDNGVWLTSGTGWNVWGAGPGPWRMYEADGANGSPSRFFIDGVLVSGNGANSGGGLTNGWGLSGYGAGPEETMDIEVAELLLFDHKLADAERIQCEEYLTTKWLGAGLPTGGAGGWRVRKAITLTRPVSWNVASPKVPVQINRGSTWNIAGQIQLSRSTTWDARVAITRTRVITWDVTGAMAKTLGQTTWKIRAAPTITRPTSWDVLSSRTITRGSTTWRVKAEVARTRVVTWNTIGLLVQITIVRPTTWKVTGRPVVTRATSWDVTTATTKALSSTTWKIKKAVGPTRVTSWDTLARTTTLIKGAAWDYLAGVTISKVATWDTRAVTTRTRVASWDDLGRVTTVTRSSTWKIRAFAYTTRMTTWDTRRAVGPTPNTTWRIVRPTATSRSTTWRARMAILAARTVSWDSRATTVLARPTTWKVRFGVTSHPLGWVVDWADNPIQLWVGGVQTQVQIFNYDVATQAYLATTGLPISYAPALDGLVRGLKSYGLWTKMNAIYPFIGGTAALHKWNLKDPRDLDAAYRLTYSGGTHSTALGWRPNLTGNTYGNKANSYLVPLGTLSQDSTHMSMYSLANTAPDDRCEMGAYNWGGGQERFNLIAMYNGGVFYYDMAANAGTNAPVPAASGLFVSTRTGPTAQAGYRNGAVVASSAAPSIPLPPVQLCVGGLNGYDQGPSNLCFGFASIGAGLSSTDNANLYNVVQAYQTALGRNI